MGRHRARSDALGRRVPGYSDGERAIAATDYDLDDLARLVAAVCQSTKYRSVSPALVAAIGRRELLARPSLKAAIWATKDRLHQVYGAFWTGQPPRYETWLDHLRVARDTADPAVFRAASVSILLKHASSRERVPVLDRFFVEMLRDLPPIGSVLDLGCGLNPLAIPWMGLDPGVRYTCYEIDAALVDFLNAYFRLAGIDAEAIVCDVTTSPPTASADLALALKLLPTINHVDRRAGWSLLRQLEARYVLVSFPNKSLGGREKGMQPFYEATFEELVAGEKWQVRRFSFQEELAFLVTK
jgi:16S rRNA (guanine(1405)-N(7))-methyltransferase